MVAHLSPLEQQLAQQPIVLPQSPFWEVFQRFGRDEVIAMMINVAGTGGLELLLGKGILEKLTGPLSHGAREGLLAVVGPVIEKSGFFPTHFRAAWEQYRTTPQEKRRPFRKYFTGAVRGGTKSLVEDLLIHDPLYVGLVYAGMQVHPETPVWLLSLVSFAASVVAVAGIEVGVNELRYSGYQRKLRNVGFRKEAYLQSRFLVHEGKAQDDALDAVREQFDLPPIISGEYHDRYFPNQLRKYSGRTPRVRLRRRTGEQGGWRQSAQIAYSRAVEQVDRKWGQRTPDQFRYFLKSVDKLYFPLGDEEISSIAEIPDAGAREVLQHGVDSRTPHDLHFTRKASYHPEKLLVAADVLHNGRTRPFYVLELKAYRSSAPLLKQAMQFVMREFPVMQITHGKEDLAEMVL